MVLEALFQTVCFIQRMRELPPDRLTRWAFEAAIQLSESGHENTWYSQVRVWFETHGLDMENLPPFQYDPDSPSGHLPRDKRNLVLRQELWKLYIRRVWETPGLGTKMSDYRD